MLVVDTSELKRPTQRKLHAAWQELQGRQVLATPTVATELAPLGAISTEKDVSVAEQQLATRAAELSAKRVNDLEQQVWWARMWRDPESPYRIVPVSPEQEELAERILTEISPRCFPGTDPEDIPDRPDARIVAESLVLGAKMLLTSNLRSIDHIEVNKWTVEHGAEWGIRPEPLLHDADDTFVNWTVEDAALERWVQTGLLACWPPGDDADAIDVIEQTAAGIGALCRGTGGKLPRAAARLLNGLEKHPDPIGLVEKTRTILPSKTVDSDREHPSYPLHRGGATVGGRITSR